MAKQIIFISIDGMTDTLGQSQVLPYLTGLSERGFAISIVSCEKKNSFDKNKNVIADITGKHRIEWNFCFYQHRLPFVSQINNFIHLKKLAEAAVQSKNGEALLHCRSYLSAVIGMRLKKKFGTKFIFDMRGFWADERIDGKIWKLKNPLHRLIYNYFKRKEKQMLTEADHIITLTVDAKNIITEWMRPKALSVDVIPCCADTDHFRILNKEQKDQARKALSISENAFIIGYLGSLGTWYMLDEMLDFFIELKKKKNNAIFFFVTPDEEQSIRKVAEAKNISTSSLLIKSARRNEVPQYISTFDTGLFFIRPTFSKRGSSPTKLAELLACGVPLITNTGVGDCDTIITKTNCGALINSFTKENYNKAIDKIPYLTEIPGSKYREVALTNFSLEKGVSIYEKIYLGLK